MGSDASEVQETLSLCNVKVHLDICKQLIRLVEKISCIIPKIEAARPGSKQGILALCQLLKANDRAKELILNCDSSKLYLAVTGKEILKRFENTRTLLIQSLSKLQSVVPLVLESQISELLKHLRATVFCLDPNEALAGKAIKALLERNASSIHSEIELLQFASSALRISSQKDILIERRSIKKLLGKTKEGNSNKRISLTYFLHILKNYDKQILEAQVQDHLTENSLTYLPGDYENTPVIPNTTDDSYIARHKVIPPEDFICFLSSKLMNDPVVISSGITFERSYIQNWFDEGHDFCPKTKVKLHNLSLKPNISTKDLIFNWCMEHGIDLSEPSSSIPEYGSLETSYNSISSNTTASSMKDIILQIDMSNMSLGSSYSNISNNPLGDSFSSVKEVPDIESRRFQFYQSIDDIQRRYLSNVNDLPWESQCMAVEDIRNFMMDNNPSCSFVSEENFLDPLVRFLHDALDKHDVDAQSVGNQLLLTFLKASRTEISQLNEEVYTMLASFLAAEPATQTLSIVELLSTRANSIPHLASFGILNSITKLLDSNSIDIQQAAIKILYNLSMNINSSSCKLASDWIPKLVPFLEDGEVAGTIINILENLLKFEELRDSIVETEGLIASIVNLLETESANDTQEHAVSILLFLCLQRECYCKLVLDEGCIPALVHVSVNGNVKGKSIASELLRILRDIEYEDEREECPVLNDDDAPGECSEMQPVDKSEKTSRFSGWKIFSKKK